MATHSGSSRFRAFYMASEAQMPQVKGGMHLPPPTNYLLSPPEEMALDSFSTDVSLSPTQQTWSNTLPPIQRALSPPVSPSASPLPRHPALNMELSRSSAAQDPPMFARSGSDCETSATPLFSSDDSQKAPPRDSLSPVQNSQCNEFAILKTFTTQRQVDEYRWALYEEARAVRRFQRRTQEPEVTPQLDQAFNKYSETKKRSVLQASTRAGVSKLQPPSLKVQTSKSPKMAKPKAAIPAASRKMPRSPAIPRSSKSLSVEPQARKRAPPSKPVVPKTEDKNWAQLPDYCPPISNLDSTPKALKVSWKPTRNDLSNDPDTHSMHPQEIEIASDLKLPGAQYMANKRRLFQAKLHCLRENENWTKTKAQLACNIDVNKTSQMYEAFQRVGWFDQKHFEKWL